MDARGCIEELEDTGMSTVDAFRQANREEQAALAAELPVARECDGIIKVGTSEDVSPVYLARDNGNVLAQTSFHQDSLSDTTIGINALSISMPGPRPNNIVIFGKNGAHLITVDFDNGSITYGADYTPDAAAKAFWEALALHRLK